MPPKIGFWIDGKSDSSGAHGTTGIDKIIYGFTGTHHTAIPNSLDLVKKAHTHVDSIHGKLAKAAECHLKLSFFIRRNKWFPGILWHLSRK